MSASGAVLSKPFIQLVSFAAKDKAAREKLWQYWLPGFTYTKREHPGFTHTYEGFFPKPWANAPIEQPEVDTEILAFESYVSEDEYNRVHMTSPVIKQFLADVPSVLGRPTTLNYLEASGTGFHTRGEHREQEVRKSGKKPFTLVVTFTLKDVEKDLPGFLEFFGPFARYVKEHEPNALTYEVFKSKNQSNQIVIFERYVDEKDLTELHWVSEKFKEFQANLGKLGTIVSKTLRSYEDQLTGFWGPQ